MKVIIVQNISNTSPILEKVFDSVASKGSFIRISYRATQGFTQYLCWTSLHKNKQGKDHLMAWIHVHSVFSGVFWL